MMGTLLDIRIKNFSLVDFGTWITYVRISRNISKQMILSSMIIANILK
jgi:hypothetical protein